MQSSQQVKIVQLAICDAAFLPDHKNRDWGHLIWVDTCPASFLNNLDLDKGYQAACMVKDHKRVVFCGSALVKRRLHHGRDELVILIPGHDLGPLSGQATVDLNPCKLQNE